MIDRAAVEKLLAGFRQQQVETVAQLNAVEGAIQACEHILAEPVAPAEPEKSKGTKQKKTTAK